jgi:hypothetical protein
MKSQYAWVLCPLLLAYCDRLKLGDGGGKQLSATSIPCIYAEREFQTSSSEALHAAVERTVANNFKEGDEKESEDFARHAVETNRNQVGEVKRHLSDNHPNRILRIFLLEMEGIG